MSQTSARPGLVDWHTYEQGRAASFGSLDTVPEDQQQSSSLSATPTVRVTSNQAEQTDGSQDLRRRRSSVAMRINSIRQMGGPNSIDNFAKSWQRAAGFREITPVRRGSVTYSEEGSDTAREFPRSQRPSPQRGLLRQQFEAAGGHHVNESAIQEGHFEQPEPTEQTKLMPSPRQSHNLSLAESQRPSVLGSALGQSYGSISSRLTPAAQRRASILIQDQRDANVRAMQAEGEEYKDELAQQHRETEIRPDGEVIERICGESTVPMTVFNSTNVLIGVGILALPLAIRYAGWILGLFFLTLAALVTSYTAKLLAKCLDTNSGSTSYGDIAFLAFGPWGRNLVESTFILELTAANVALIILFGDSMNSLIPAISITGWKSIIALGLIPLNFVPFKTLSVTSVLGIVCTIGIILLVLVDGLLKPHSPGSLRPGQVAKTYAFPETWATIPLSLGLFMAPWGGHSVFPAIYKDMRHPKKYNKAVNWTYLFTYGLDFAMAVIGYLMFGDFVRDEVTSNILTSDKYPHALSVLIVVLICIIPITKIPLTNRPMTDTINKKFLIDLRQMDPKARRASEKSWRDRSARGGICVLANAMELGAAVLLPDFDSVMALMGSAFCFTICVIMPVTFHLRIFSSEGQEISTAERVLCWALIVFSTALAVLGTIFAILPKEKAGMK